MTALNHGNVVGKWPAFDSMCLPPDLVSLPTVIAEPWLKIDDDDFLCGLEGPAFDVNGDLYFTFGFHFSRTDRQSKICRVTRSGEYSVFYEAGGKKPTGIAFHKDGRMFVVCITGEVLVFQGDVLEEELHPMVDGRPFVGNDMVFARNGDLYITDFAKDGHILRLNCADDYHTTDVVCGGLNQPNGISFSPDERTLWIGEGGTNMVVKVMLMPEGMPPMVIRTYHSVGDANLDSNKVDANGNLYQGLVGAGRILILNPHGIPVGNVIVPGREQGLHLRIPNLVLDMETSIGYLEVSGKGGEWIYRFPSVAPGVRLYSHT